MSKSSSSQASTTSQEDSRAAVEGDNGIAVGGGGSVIITDEFPEDVAIFAGDVLDVLKQGQDLSAKSVDTTIEAVQTIAAREQSSALFAQDIIEKLLPLAAIGGVVILGVFYFKKGRK